MIDLLRTVMPRLFDRVALLAPLASALRKIAGAAHGTLVPDAERAPRPWGGGPWGARSGATV